MKENEGKVTPIDVLLVEDSPGDVRLTQESFRAANRAIHLHVASDGVEAMAFLRQQGKYTHAPRPDFILLDLNLPRMDGREVLALIKGDDDLRSIPTIILTTSEAEVDILRAYELHANCYLSKPVKLEAFEAMVKSINDFWLSSDRSHVKRVERRHSRITDSVNINVTYDFTKDSILKSAHAYWRSKRDGRNMPRRQDIEPTEIPRLLPNIQITEMVDGGKRIRYRLAGSAIVEAYGSELKGKYFDEIFTGERLRFVEDNYRVMCERMRPVLVVNRYHSARNVELVCHRLIMPLSEDGKTVNQCLTAMSFQFPGKAKHWMGQWSENSPEFDLAMSHCEAIEIGGDA